MRRLLLFAVALAAALPSTASAEASITGWMRNYTGLLLEAPNDYALLQNTLELSIGYTGDKAALKVTPYVYQNVGQELDLGLRQAYVDLYFDSFDLRVGKQQIVWGKADGVFITDVVSPKDLSEFLLRDFDEIRMGITALKANYYLGDHNFELVLVPVFTPTRMPAEGSRWRATPPFPVQPTFDRSQEDVSLRLDSGEAFLRFSAITSLVDFELMGGYTWDDDPALHVTKTIDPATKKVTALTVTPTHHRLALAGGSFSTTLGPLVLRGEGAWYHGKLFSSAAPAAPEGLVEKDYLHYLVGLDTTVAGIRFGAQFIQRLILDHETPMLADEWENTVTLLARTDFLQEKLKLEAFAYLGLEAPDALVRARVSYDVSDGLVAMLGTDLFFGTTGTFGQFDRNDMAWARLRYSF